MVARLILLAYIECAHLAAASHCAQHIPYSQVYLFKYTRKTKKNVVIYRKAKEDIYASCRRSNNARARSRNFDGFLHTTHVCVVAIR